MALFFLAFLLEITFLAPSIAPAPISKAIPPSIGTHGGGQQPGPPPGGGGGADKATLTNSTKTVIT
ncbi:MAG: hypothetical protein JSU07_11365 [Bacteroidetes bacterium]|nr:hypothetical protein [Bacteroidota bacterium]